MGCFFQFLVGLKSKKSEKRKDKEKTAIGARTNGVQQAVKSSRGGVAFVLGLTDRPTTPFRGFTPRPGKITMSVEEKETIRDEALVRKELMLQEKTLFARADSERRASVQQRKVEIEIEALIDEYEAGKDTPRAEEGHIVPSSSA